MLFEVCSCLNGQFLAGLSYNMDQSSMPTIRHHLCRIFSISVAERKEKAFRLKDARVKNQLDLDFKFLVKGNLCKKSELQLNRQRYLEWHRYIYFYNINTFYMQCMKVEINKSGK